MPHARRREIGRSWFRDLTRIALPQGLRKPSSSALDCSFASHARTLPPSKAGIASTSGSMFRIGVALRSIGPTRTTSLCRNDGLAERSKGHPLSPPGILATDRHGTSIQRSFPAGESRLV